MTKDKPILVTQSSLPPFEEYCKEIAGIWETRHLTNMGPKHNELEVGLGKYLGVDNVTLYTNGHLALENMLEAYGVTGEIITTPFTFVSTTNAILRSGLMPVFCDVKEDDYTIDPEKIEDLITDRTSAILAVHVYGNVCDDDVVSKIAKKHNLKVFYDAAHAFGVRKNGVSVATYGDCSMFSFHATKVFNTVEGGALCYKDGAMKPVLDSYKNFGLDASKDYSVMGGNAKMSEFHAAMGICNLRHLDGEILKRKRVFGIYASAFDGVEGIKVCVPPADVEHNYAYMPVLFTGAFNRDDVFDALAKENVFARKYFYPLTNRTTWFRKNFVTTQPTPVAEFVSDNVLCLPMYAGLSDGDAERIADIVLKSAKHRREVL